jgi:hypothetical protein
MITLSTPPQLKTVLGGAGSTAYDKFYLSQIVYDTDRGTINGLGKMTSTTSPDAPVLDARYHISGGILEIDVERLNFLARVKMNAGALAAVAAMIAAAQSALEQGMIDLGALSGTQKAGV